MFTARRSLRAALVALLVFSPFPALTAQSLTPGTRVRVKSSQVVAPIIGSYQGIKQDSVVVIEDGTAAQVWTFSRPAVEKLEVSVGMKGGNREPMARWGLIGLGVGAAAGWLVAVILEESTNDQYSDILSTLVGAGVGTAAGVFYGSRKLDEHWSSVPVPGRMGIGPTPRTLRVGFSASF